MFSKQTALRLQQWPVAPRTWVRAGWQGWKEVWPSGAPPAVGWLHPMQTDSLTWNPQNGKWAERCWRILHGEPANSTSGGGGGGGGLYRRGGSDSLHSLRPPPDAVPSSEGKETGPPVAERTPFK